MSTPQQPQGDPNQQPQERIVYVEKKKKGGCMKWGAIILGAIILIAVLATVFSGGGDDSSSDSQGSSNGGDQAATEQSGPATIGETVSLGKADVTASNLRQSSDALGSYLCADVAFVNTSDSESLSLNGLMDWKLTDPNGVTITQTVGGETDYDPVEVGPGGNKSGVVCFDSVGAPGEYTLTFEEGLSFSSDTATWVATL